MNFLSITPQELLFSFPQEFLMGIGLLGLLVICPLSNITRVHIFTIIFSLSILCVIFGFFACNTYQPLFLSSTGTNFAKSLVCSLFILVLLLDNICVKSGKNTLLLMGFSLFSSLLVLSANDWFFLFLSLELLTLTSYCLIALPRTQRSLEAVLKYFAAGAISTCFLLFGLFLLFANKDTLSMSEFPSYYAAARSFSTFALSAILLKTGAAPFHYWVVDAYEGAPSIVTVWLATGLKLSIFVILSRIVLVSWGEGVAFWSPMIAFCSGLSILIGCFGALYQKRLKRLLAYSSINNVGYALAGLAVANAGGLQASLVYLFFYNMALLLFFSFLLGAFSSRRLTYVSDIRFLRKSSYCSIVAALCLFSMAGIPPLSGFFIKFFVLSELVYSKYYLLAAIGTFSSIISSFYYIALIKTLFFEDSGTENLEEFLYQKAAYQPPLVAFTCSLAFFFIAYPLFPGFINSLFTELALGLTLPFM